METRTHQRLADTAIRLLVREGCCAAAREVLCPIARFRVDVAGYHDGRADSRDQESTLGLLAPARVPRDTDGPKPEPSTVIIECKQSRADFLRDADRLDRLLALRAGLESRMRELEERLIKPREPHLRHGDEFLFDDLEAWDFARSGSTAYQHASARLHRLESHLYGHTKFWTMYRYSLASQFYLLAPTALIRTRELPTGWGLLECPGSHLRAGRSSWSASAAAGAIRIVVRSSDRLSRLDFRMRLLRNIAAAATRASLAHIGSAAPQMPPGAAMDQRSHPVRVPRMAAEAAQVPSLFNASR